MVVGSLEGEVETPAKPVLSFVCFYDKGFQNQAKLLKLELAK